MNTPQKKRSMSLVIVNRESFYIKPPTCPLVNRHWAFSLLNYNYGAKNPRFAG